MSEFQCFGTPELFEIAARWTGDAEPRERLPLEGGWSTGDLRITVGRQVLTARSIDEIDVPYLSWYLWPVMDWLITNWTSLFHEERYAWPDLFGAPAVFSVFAAQARYIGSSDESEVRCYREVQAWWQRHALRAADAGALCPDICFRRLGDDIEISWGGRQPVHSPDGFVLSLSPGYATLAVEEIVRPLWEFLDWCLKPGCAITGQDRKLLDELRSKFSRLKRTPLSELELTHLDARLQALIGKARQDCHVESTSTKVKGIPAIASMDDAVLMYGGVEPDLGEQDVFRLMRFLSRNQRPHGEFGLLADLVEDRGSNVALAPYQEGYELAEDVREQLRIPLGEGNVNIREILGRLKVSVEEIELDTISVRGAAVAGKGFSPAILINTSSAYNRTEDGRRFTLAHELCHILFDRTRARKLSHVSGPWTSPRTEKRANAFAAMFLASRVALKRLMKGVGRDDIQALATEVGMGVSALVEHLYNLSLLDEAQREQLRLYAN